MSTCFVVGLSFSKWRTAKNDKNTRKQLEVRQTPNAIPKYQRGGKRRHLKFRCNNLAKRKTKTKRR